MPLPDGLPAGAWLYLSRDRRVAGLPRYRRIPAQAELERAGVEIELPEDPEHARSRRFCRKARVSRSSSSASFPRISGDSKRTVFKTVAAFANGYGGNIVFGIEKDEATVCGLDGIDPLKERDRLTQLVRSIRHASTRSRGPPVYEFNGKMILVLSVEPGTRPALRHHAARQEGQAGRVLRPAGPTTFPARPEEIRNAVLATAPTPAPCWCRQSHPRHATRRYSLIMPPVRVCLRTPYWPRMTGRGSGFSGAAECSERCGRC